MRILAAIALVLFPSVSLSADWYVDRVGGNNANAGNAPGAAWKDIAYANTAAGPVTNDRFFVAASTGIYDAVPARAGTVWIGDSTAWRKVMLPGTSTTPMRRRNMTLIGFSFMGSVKIGVDSIWSCSQPAPVCRPPTEYGCLEQTFSAAGLLIRKSFFYASLEMVADSVRIQKCFVGNDSNSVVRFIAKNFSMDTKDNVLLDNEFRLREPEADVWFIIQWRFDQDYSSARHRRWEVGRNKWYVTVAATTYHPDYKVGMFNRIADSFFHDNYFAVRDSNAFDKQFVWRDGLAYNWRLRDTTEAYGIGGSTGNTRLILSGSGNSGCCVPCRAHNNRWTWNVWRQGTVGPLYHEGAPGDGDSVSYSQFLVNNAVSNGGYIIGAPVDNVRCYYVRNVFGKWGGGSSAMRIDPFNCSANCGAWSGDLIMSGNIYYTGGSTSSSVYAGGAKYCLTDQAKYKGDYNLFSHYSQDKEVRDEICDQAGSAVIGRPGLLGPACPRGHECHSSYGSPVFTDSSYALFDPHINAGSAAIGSGPGGSDCGIYDFATADVTAPNQVTDVWVVDETSSSASLNWVATGDDGVTGKVSQYEITVTTSGFPDQKFYIHFPSVAAGSPDSYVLTNLRPDTMYEVTIIPCDEAFNCAMASSAVIFHTTPLGGGFGP